MLMSVDLSKGFTSQSFGLGESPFEMFKCKTLEEQQQKVNEMLGQPEANGRPLEANTWLPFAAKEYNLSTDIRDYILVPVPMLFNDIPNTNGDSLSIGELLRFNTDIGLQMYKTFRGMPTYLEHDNQDITKSKGIILDVFLRKMNRHGNGRYFKLVELLSFDRTKDPELCNAILKKEINSYSVGFYFKSYECSICGKTFGEGGHGMPCEHTAPRRPTYMQDDGRLVYRKCKKAKGFETSAVASPAYISAISPHVMNLRGF